jgi:membrane associated rhomboid family serine protease
VLIPIGHDQRIRRLPWVTFSIIGLCTAVQIYSTFVAPDPAVVLRKLAALATDSDGNAVGNVDPAELMRQLQDLIHRIPILRFGYRTGSGFNFNLIASAFVHAGWGHLIGNMLFLWLSGSVLEDRWGRAKFLAFYLVGAVASALCFDAFYHGPPTVLVGASGAISAALGAFLVFYWHIQIRFLYWWMMRTGTFFVAAYIALPAWLAEQVLWQVLDPGGAVSSVAYSAHIGGFAFGAGFALSCNFIFGARTHDPDDEDDAAPPVDNETPAAAAALPVASARYKRPSEIAISEPVVAAEPAPAIARTPTGPTPAMLAAALRNGDLHEIRTIGSRLIFGLARTGEHELLLATYAQIAERHPDVPLTDGAFGAAANAADALGDTDRFVAIATEFGRRHPLSGYLPKVWWRLAEIHRDRRQIDLAVAALHTLAERFPDDPLGVRARDALASRH